ncbi:MAG: cyclic pyranopterin monophosphate synthase MoaC [Candidatus Aureabacteria bacterium]|nr:cyclic pyranopterin monophosphate synthase MoaC [Candidatus Auribacterota bacterium]
MGPRLSHLDDTGHIRMVDVTYKPESLREAVARGAVILSPVTLSLISRGRITKGNVLTTARIAGILAAKRVHELIPLTHPLSLSHIAVDFVLRRQKNRARIEIEASVRLLGRTGAEMEALTAVAVAGLTVYDMCKAVDSAMRITDIHLVRKSGGKTKPV